jgi:PAT family beta-lactamase induction signal transducer AmpG
MAITLLGALTSGALEDTTTLTYLAWVFFIHNCFAALQDVATDALAVDLLEDHERGRVNGLMWGSKLFGIAVGGAGMATIIASFSLATAVWVQVALLLTVLLLVCACRERPGERLFPWSSGAAQIITNRASGFFITSSALLRALSLRTTFMLVTVALTLSVAEGLYEPVTVEFFVQRLGWSAQEFAQSQGVLGLLGELTGALLGGFFCDKFGQRRVAAIGVVLVMTTLLTFGLTSESWDNPGYMHVLLLPAFRGFMAFTTVSMFSLYMRVSWTTAAASQFTLYMAMTNLGYAFGAQLNSWIPLAGYELSLAKAYVLGGLLPLIPLVLLFTFDPNAVDKHKREDQALASLI